MGTQKSTLRITGRVGSLSYYQTRRGDRVRCRKGVSGKRVRTAPEFVRTRENASEFGRASKAGKALRIALGPRVDDLCDSLYHNRLRSVIYEIIKSDPIHTRGKRLFSAGNPGLLLNFQFNNARDFALILDTSLYSSTLDPHSGIADICIASFVPGRDLRFPQPATHFRFFAAAIAIDFDKLTFHKDISDSGPLLINQLPSAVINLAHQLPANTGQTWLLILGIQFEMIINEVSYEMKNKQMNGMMILEVKNRGL